MNQLLFRGEEYNCLYTWFHLNRPESVPESTQYSVSVAGDMMWTITRWKILISNPGKIPILNMLRERICWRDSQKVSASIPEWVCRLHGNNPGSALLPLVEFVSGCVHVVTDGTSLEKVQLPVLVLQSSCAAGLVSVSHLTLKGSHNPADMETQTIQHLQAVTCYRDTQVYT